MRPSLLVLLSAILVAAPAFAQNTTAKATVKPVTPASAPLLPSPRPPSATMIPMGDTNHDGKLSKREWQAMQDKRFSTMDTNGDGYIDAAEFDKYVTGQFHPIPPK